VSYLTYYAANHLGGARRAMPLNSLYAVWAILFSVVLLGLQPTAQLMAGVLISFAGAVIVVSSGSRARAEAAGSEVVSPY
jgi:drug/metabolite transporter (DMT)-like permease